MTIHTHKLTMLYTFAVQVLLCTFAVQVLLCTFAVQVLWCTFAVQVLLCTFAVQVLLYTFAVQVLKAELGMQSPDIELDDGKGTILLTCEEGVTEGNESKYLSEFNITEGSRLKCDDFLQEYNLIVVINVV